MCAAIKIRVRQSELSVLHLVLSGGRRTVDQYFDNVIVFDTETETWSEVGSMKAPRARTGVSVVNLDVVKEYATECVTKEIPSKLHMDVKTKH